MGKFDDTPTFTIFGRPPEMPEIWVDPHTPAFNEAKHKATCAKNRAKRKRKKRNKRK